MQVLLYSIFFYPSLSRHPSWVVLSLSISHSSLFFSPCTYLSYPLSSLSIPYWQDAYIQERADAMQNIEETIVELGGIFKQLAVMVKEQEEQVVR